MLKIRFIFLSLVIVILINSYVFAQNNLSDSDLTLLDNYNKQILILEKTLKIEELKKKIEEIKKEKDKDLVNSKEDISKQNLFDSSNFNTIQQQINSENIPYVPPVVNTEIEEPLPTIISIEGKSGEYFAVLKFMDDRLLKVKENDSIGKDRVIYSISANGVKIKEKSKIKSLSFDSSVNKTPIMPVLDESRSNTANISESREYYPDSTSAQPIQ